MKRARYRSGPLVWCAILAATCLLLFLFQKILWLVVPFLFALIIYYLLFPLQQRLVLGGMSRDASAAAVSIASRGGRACRLLPVEEENGHGRAKKKESESLSPPPDSRDRFLFFGRLSRTTPLFPRDGPAIPALDGQRPAPGQCLTEENEREVWRRAASSPSLSPSLIL